MDAWHYAAKVEEIAPGEMKSIEIEDIYILIINLDGHFYAIEDRCSHEEAPLDGGEIENDEIICPLHGARFCVKTGKALCAPAYEDINTFAVKIEDNQIFVKV